MKVTRRQFVGCENKKSYKYGKVGAHKNGKKSSVELSWDEIIVDR